MTPVATPIATQAISWDAALAQTLESAADHPFADGSHATVHSVHARVVNVLCAGDLVAIVDDSLDDAPGTVRVPSASWQSDVVVPGAPVRIDGAALVLPAPGGEIVVRAEGAAGWMPVPADLCCIPTAQLRDASALLAEDPGRTSPTPFGAAAAALLALRVEDLRTAVLNGEPAAVTATAQSLVGLGEGLTPTGDDILSGLAFLAAQPGMRLGAHLPAIAAVDTDATTLLAAVTLRHALRGRARQRIHDLALAIGGDRSGILRAAARVREIGHTSGEDLLTGIRLALDLEAALRDGSR
ncbi:DUF2877 domain-containing protein [Microbacterium mangrovi]|uniref:DUF2877 domain-containing protein n=1 Tax=Microbacterium mangrovi TaxID=1348253 RepID=UPI000689A71A|nr:DUF2877 domain-containing protein [Microbacterium mangrovi]